MAAPRQNKMHLLSVIKKTLLPRNSKKWRRGGVKTIKNPVNFLVFTNVSSHI